MRQIEIDDEVFAYLQGKALAFVETPNKTLRRLFELDKASPKPAVAKLTATKIKKKQPKANLPVLISSGLIQEGQSVFLVDYQDNQLPKYRAVINGSSLKWQGNSYSMSDLARELLKKEGYNSNSVRGPAHWVTEDGVTIKRLWQQHLGTAAN